MNDLSFEFEIYFAACPASPRGGVGQRGGDGGLHRGRVPTAQVGRRFSGGGGRHQKLLFKVRAYE